MPSYKLYYFNARGRAEGTRYLFALSNTPYEDVRFSFEDWPKHKANSPTGKAPYLEVDGKAMAESYAIVRYLARQFGFMGSNEWEAGQIDMIMGYLDDCGTPFGKIMWEHKDNPEKRKEALDAYKKDTFCDYLKRIEGMLDGKKFLVGDKLSAADVSLYYVTQCMKGAMGDDLLASAPNTSAHYDRIASMPETVKWEKERPESQF